LFLAYIVFGLFKNIKQTETDPKMEIHMVNPPQNARQAHSSGPSSPCRTLKKGSHE
jgi:hypothetical protein